MAISLNKIIPSKDQVDELYTLLKKRKYSISHNNIPSETDHYEFVSNHPYVVWYLIYKEKLPIGSVYVQSDNSIGLNLIDYSEQDVIDVINYIKENHEPLSPIASVRSNAFFVNVASENAKLIQILKELEIREIQRSYLL